MKWAIIRTGGKQYKVAEGDILDVEKLNIEENKPVSFDEVLAVGGDEVKLGLPLVEKAKVDGKVLSTFRGKKIRVVKFKSKSRYSRSTGHRQSYTKVQVEKIVA